MDVVAMLFRGSNINTSTTNVAREARTCIKSYNALYHSINFYNIN